MLMIEVYKIRNELAPQIMDSVLTRRNITYNFRNLQKFQLEKKNDFLLSINFKLPCTPTMDGIRTVPRWTYPRRIVSRSHFPFNNRFNLHRNPLVKNFYSHTLKNDKHTLT